MKKGIKLVVVAAALLAAGAVAAAKSANKRLWDAALSGTAADVRKAIKKGANVNARDNGGITPLMQAAWKNTDIDVLKVLLYAGSDVNARDGGTFDDKDNGTFDDKILKIIYKAQEVVIDYNRDGEINCTDRAVAFKLVWDQAYNPSDCELVRNCNEGVIYNGVVFNHLFVRVWLGFEWVYVEPAYKPGCWKSYKMEDVWGDRYNPWYNYYGETEKWLYRCGGL